MNDRTDINRIHEEICLVNISIISAYNENYSLPFIKCISTSDKPQARCGVDGKRCILDSFLGSYVNSNCYEQYVSFIIIIYS